MGCLIASAQGLQRASSAKAPALQFPKRPAAVAYVASRCTAAPVQEAASPIVAEPEPIPEPEAVELEATPEATAVIEEPLPAETALQVEEPAIVEPPVTEPNAVEAELEELPVDELEALPAEEVDEAAQAAEEAPEISMAVVQETQAEEPLQEPEELQVDVAPVIETMSEIMLPDPAAIDDEELYSTFEHETEFYIPDYTDEQLEPWLPLPEPEGLMVEPNPDFGRLNEDHLQLAPEPVTPRPEWSEPLRQTEAFSQDVCVEEVSMPPVAQLEIEAWEEANGRQNAPWRELAQRVQAIQRSLESAYAAAIDVLAG